MKAEKRWWIWLAILCIGGVFHSSLYALTNPVFESPDEPGHLQYANGFASGRGMPNQYREFLPEGHQPPLYYGSIGALLRLTGGPIVVGLPPSGVASPAPQYDHRPNPFRGPRDRVLFYALRLLGSLLVGLAVLQVGRAARRILPDGHVWMAAPMLMAGWPQLAFIGGSISNDGMVALMGACVAFAATCCMTAPERRRNWIALGIYIGLAFLTKKNAIALAPAVLVFVGAMRLYSGEKVSRNYSSVSLSALIALLLFSPILIRNYFLYSELLGHRMEVETMPNLVYPQSLASMHFKFIFPRIVPESLVAHFGWMVVEVKSVFLWRFIWSVVVMGALGLGAMFDRRRGPLVWFFLGSIGLNLAGLVYYNLYFPQPQGRLLFPSLAGLVLLCALGLFEVSRRMRFQYKAWLLLPLLVALTWFDVLCFYTNVNFYEWFGPELGF